MTELNPLEVYLIHVERLLLGITDEGTTLQDLSPSQLKKLMAWRKSIGREEYNKLFHLHVYLLKEYKRVGLLFTNDRYAY